MAAELRGNVADDNEIIEDILINAASFFFDEDEEDVDDLGRYTVRLQRQVAKVSGYAEVTVPMQGPDVFKSHFRLQRSSVQGLLQLLSGAAHPSMGRPETDMGKQILMFLWCLANLECFRSIADRFGMSKSSACRIIHRVGVSIMDHAFSFISWPSGEEARRTIEGFQAKAGFPGTIGAIDCCHIKIKAPKKDPQSYVNRNGFHSVVLQAICDDRMKFLHCMVGEAGSLHDARIYRRSDFFRSITPDTFPFFSHLDGDAAYPLSQHMMTPYKNYGNLTAQHVRYNDKHSKTRVVVERAFGLLKGRFRRLLYLETRKPDIIVVLIISACVLHNVCLMWGDDFQVRTADTSDDEEDDFTQGGDSSGVTKRDYIRSIL